MLGVRQVRIGEGLARRLREAKGQGRAGTSRAESLEGGSGG